MFFFLLYRVLLLWIGLLYSSLSLQLALSVTFIPTFIYSHSNLVRIMKRGAVTNGYDLANPLSLLDNLGRDIYETFHNFEESIGLETPWPVISYLCIE